MSGKSKKNRDALTYDLFTDFDPSKIAICFDDAQRNSGLSFAQEVSRAVAATLNDSDMSRDEIAEQMSAYLGKTVTKVALDAYASPARETHNLTFERAVALLHATRDPRLFGSILRRYGFAVVEERYLGAVEEAMIEAEKEELARKQTELDHQKHAARRRWKGGHHG